LQISKESCPLCDRYAVVDTKTTKITCKVFCEANGMTRAEAQEALKQRREEDQEAAKNAERNKGKGVIDPWAK
jgi:hypothetical protein